MTALKSIQERAHFTSEANSMDHGAGTELFITGLAACGTELGGLDQGMGTELFITGLASGSGGVGSGAWSKTA